MNEVSVPTFDTLSLVAVRAESAFQDTRLGYATCFFYRRGDRTYLVTNWHVVSGRHPETGLVLHSMGAIPDCLILRVPEVSVRDGARLRASRDRVLPLYETTGDHKRVPRWFEHPTHGSRVDVVAIPLDISDSAIVPANDASHQLDDFRLAPSLDVFILGFPRGISGRVATPIWKRGTIATETDLDHDGMPMYLVDAATREGMSGAPVYAQISGFWMPSGAATGAEARLDRGRMLAGIYASRIHAEDELKAQLGIVWKVRAIDAVIDGQCLGQSSFDQ